MIGCMSHPPPFSILALGARSDKREMDGITLDDSLLKFDGSYTIVNFKDTTIRRHKSSSAPTCQLQL